MALLVLPFFWEPYLSIFLRNRNPKKKSIEGNPIQISPKDKGFIRYILGGTIFGLGWALAGACPGPMYILLGTGVFSMLLVIFAAMLGTFTYGVLKDKLPH